jgi:hypothetical protein
MLRPNLEKQEGWALPYDLYILAMSQHRLGETARARDNYDCAIRWVPLQRNLDQEHEEELTEIRAEAEKLLSSRGTE